MIQLTITDASGKKHKVEYKNMDDIKAHLSLCGCGQVDIVSPDGLHVESLGDADPEDEHWEDSYIERLMEREQ